MASNPVLTKQSLEQIEASSDAEPSLRLNIRHTAAEERQLVRKLDRRILPIACLLYLFACLFPSFSPSPSINISIVLDRSDLGNARLQGLPDDILGGDPTGNLFDWINSGFFFSYVCPLVFFTLPTSPDMLIFQIICQVPATVISKLYPPQLWLAGAAIGWGMVSTLLVSHA